jgi:hypothetical protein
VKPARVSEESGVSAPAGSEPKLWQIRRRCILFRRKGQVLAMSEYWVYTWIDSHGIRTIDELNASLASAGVVDELKEAAGLVGESWRTSRVEARPLSLIAGAGIDLSGRLDCNATSCRRAQVDRLFRRTWHYFETIVARDAIAEDLVVHRKCPDAELRDRLPPHFETVLMVRELGAEPLVEFSPRIPACFEHWRQHAKEAGIDDIAEREAKIVNPTSARHQRRVGS